MNQLDICHYLAWHSALIGYDKNWLAQYLDNVTGLDIGSWCPRFSLLVGQHYEGIMNVHCNKLVPGPGIIYIDVTRM